MDERHRQAVAALAAMLREAHQVLDMERNEYTDIGGEVVTVRTVLDEYRAALADATKRAEANATEVHLLGERVRIECERRDQARWERDAAIKRAEAAEACTAKACGCEWEDGSRRLHGGDLDVMCDYHRGVEGRAAELAAVAAALKHANDLREAERRDRDAAIARADALAARLAEVDGEHPA